MNEWTARFPIALAAFLGVVLTFLIGKRLFDSWTGILAALFLATANEFFWLAMRVNLDTVMTLFILASIYALVLALTGNRHRLLCFRLAFLFSGVATITKGPLGLFVPFLTLIIYLILTRDGQMFRKVPWISGGLIFLLVLLLGLGPTCLAGGKAYTRELLFHQTITRYLHGINHLKDPLFYLYAYPESLLPWVLFLPTALLMLAVKKKETAGETSPFLFLLIWILANLGFLSFSKSKRYLYALSEIPAGCLLLGYYFTLFLRGSRRFVTGFKIPAYLFGVLTVLSGIALPFASPFLHSRIPEITLPLIPCILTAIGTILLGLTICFLTGTGRWKGVTLALLLMVSLTYFASTRWVFPMFNPIRSPRALGVEVQRLVDQGYTLRTLGDWEYTRILFYTRLTHLDTLPPVPETISAFFKTAPKPAILLRQNRLGQFARMAKVPLRVLWQGKVERRDFFVLRPE